MSTGSLGRRYAKALMEIGEADGTYERIGSEVASLAEAMKSSPDLTQTLTNPVFPRDDREKIVLALLTRMGASTTVIHFCKLLLDRERMPIIPDVSRALSAMIDEKSGQLTAQVTSAVPLSAEQQQQIRSALEKLSGKTIKIATQEDPDLLGGIVAKVGDLVYDGSVRTQLQELKRNIAA